MAAAIRIDNLGKWYKIGLAEEMADTFREALIQLAKAPWRRLRAMGERTSERETMWALRGVSFEVQPGEVVGVIGHNGAGKSTLLKILSRITAPSEGRVEVRGRLGSLLEVGTGFHPDLTGRENIYLNGSILGIKRREIDAKFDEIVSFAGVDRFVDTPVKRYSSGMQVRLAFAVAANLEPEILLIDEVLAVGDIGFQRKCLGKMHDVAGHGRTVLFVSHNMAAVRSLCSRCVLLSGGRVVMEGPADTVVDHYIAQNEDAADAASTRAAIPAEGDRRFVLRPKDACDRVAVRCGEPIELDFTVEVPTEYRELSAGLFLATPSGQRVCAMGSKVQQVPSAPGASRRWRVRCDMGRIPLNAGTYHATIYVGNGQVDVARFIKAMTIRVEEHDVFGWGAPLPNALKWGSMYWAPQWQIEAVSMEAAIDDSVNTPVGVASA